MAKIISRVKLIYIAKTEIHVLEICFMFESLDSANLLGTKMGPRGFAYHFGNKNRRR